MKQLSIIIPIYNVESYLERCLRSLEEQDIPKDAYEIICINDGSPDNSRGVVIRLQKEYNNIVLIDQENQGVSKARNRGIENAGGRYLLFIDPDDYVDTNSFNRILSNADEKEAEVLFLGFTVLNVDETVNNQLFYNRITSKVYTGIEAYLLSRGNGRVDPDRMWAVLFKMELINQYGIRLLPDVPYLEDGEIMARILCLAERCAFDEHSFYQRTTRPGSATNSKLFHSEKALNGFLLAAGNLKKFQQNPGLNEKQKAFLNQPIIHFVLLVIASGGNRLSVNRMHELKRRLNESGLRKLDLTSVVVFYARMGYLYNQSIFLLYSYSILRNVLRSIKKRIIRGVHLA